MRADIHDNAIRRHERRNPLRKFPVILVEDRLEEMGSPGEALAKAERRRQRSHESPSIGYDGARGPLFLARRESSC
jgi:hypothetical protein